MVSKLGPIAFTAGTMILAAAVFTLVGHVSGSTRLRTDARRVILMFLSASGAVFLLCAAYGLLVITRVFRT